jgi:hypothetical protein
MIGKFSSDTSTGDGFHHVNFTIVSRFRSLDIVNPAITIRFREKIMVAVTQPHFSIAHPRRAVKLEQ